MSENPWTEPVSLPWLRAAWMIFALLALPSLLFQLGLREVYLPLCSTLFALPACIASPAALGLKKIQWQDAAAAFAGYIAIIFLSVLLLPLWQKLLDYFNVAYADKQELMRLLTMCGRSQAWMLFFSVCVLTPLVEEVLFRRIIFGELIKINRIWAFIVTSLIFAVMHFFILGLPQLFVMGVFFQLIFLGRKNLSAAIFLHAIVNCCAFAKTVFWG